MPYEIRLFCLCIMMVVVVVVLGQDDAAFAPEQGGGQDEVAFAPEQGGEGVVPALFIFGDSLIDNGNNNDLTSLAKANYLPYGIDYDGGPTGRFSNGYTMVDTIAELLGLPKIPPHSQASGDEMLYGLNFASAAAGILDITGRNFVGRIPFKEQIKNFESSLDELSNRLGAAEMSKSLSRCMFFVGMGSNDYLNNYLMPNYQTKDQYNGEQYANLLMREYSQQLTKLYNLGARKFVLAGLGSMGCIPSILAQSRFSRCSEDVNKLILPFNANLKTMMNNLSSNLPGSRFIYVDVHNMFEDILTNYRSYGFHVINRGCCGIGRNRGQITCLPMQTPCPNRNEYVFWDAFHPTEAVNVIMGRKAFSGDTDAVYPMNIEQLANL